ncbi:unnamed protein product [Spodoptera exigua]|nr:unnamed protein product [Spodoptera exigua]
MENCAKEPESPTKLSKSVSQNGNEQVSSLLQMINYCKMADQCQHDFVPICAQDSLGITRMFNDNCDLFEYNCDEKKQYRHVKLSICKYEPIGAPPSFT